MTADALMALVVASFLIAGAVNLIAEKRQSNDEVLVEYGYDFLAVAEKTGALENISWGCSKVNGTYPCTLPFRDLLRMTPQSICIEAEMTFQNGSLFYHADNYNDTYIGERTGCLKTYATGEVRPMTFVKVSRVQVRDGVIRPVKLELWFKGWKNVTG
jgi:hypothetical protein